MSIVEKNTFRKIRELSGGILRYNFESKFHQLTPRSLMINLTYKCNSRCIMCNIWQIKPKNEVGLNKWKEVMKDKIFSDIRTLTISGGEPLLYRDYEPAIKLFINSMPKLRRLVVNTNGFKPKMIEKKITQTAKYCQQKGIKFAVSVSIDGVGKTHDDIRRIKNGFDKSFETVKRLKKISKKYNISVGVSSLLLRQNISKYPEMKKWLLKNNIEGGFQIVGFHEYFLKNIKTKSKLSINKAVKKDFLNALADIRDSRNRWSMMRYYWEDMIEMYKNGSPRTTPCTFLKDDFVIDSLGDVYYCLSVRPIGNFLKEDKTVGEIYFDSKNIKFRNNLPKTACKNCNSGCNATNGIAFDAKRYLWFKLTGQLWPGKVLNVS